MQNRARDPDSPGGRPPAGLGAGLLGPRGAVCRRIERLLRWLGPRQRGGKEEGFDALARRSASASRHGGRKRTYRDEGGPFGEFGVSLALAA